MALHPIELVQQLLFANRVCIGIGRARRLRLRRAHHDEEDKPGKQKAEQRAYNGHDHPPRFDRSGNPAEPRRRALIQIKAATRSLPMMARIPQQREQVQMSYATIMVHLDVDESSDARLRLAAGLAKRFGATLVGTSAALVPAEYGPSIGPERLAAEQRSVATLLARQEAAFRKIAGAAEVKHEWRSDNDLPDDFLPREARAADLVIVGRVPPSTSVLRAVDPGRVVLRGGRPVLVVPPGIERLRAERIVIGWKDAREARRAVFDALPFLHEAKHVRVVEISDTGEEARAQRRLDDVAHYLMRHRIAAETRVVSRGDEVGAALMRVAQEAGADLIVAGAYGQSRLGEWVFGGATRSLLSGSAVCCLFSH